MSGTVPDVLRDQGRGLTGALLVVGLSFIYTTEGWWLAWRLPLPYLVTYAALGLGVVVVLTREIGFREAETDREERNAWRLAADFAELLFQSFLTAYLVFLLFGIVRLDDRPIVIIRMGLVQVVPLGFGAAIANRFLSDADTVRDPRGLSQSLAVNALGAVFVIFPMAPTVEVERIAIHAGWGRLAGVVVFSVVVVHLVLHELEFMGHSARTESRSKRLQVGYSVVTYTVGATIAVVLLVAFGQFAGTTPAEWVRQTIVLSFPAAVGASAGEVVL